MAKRALFSIGVRLRGALGFLVFTSIACNAVLGIEKGKYADDAGGGTTNTDGDVPPITNDGGDAEVPPECVGKNFLSDPQHCGACKHDCLGGDCVQAVCQPVTLFVGSVTHFVVSGDRIYFTSPGANTVRSVPITFVDGGARVEYTGTTMNDQPRRIAASASTIFWRDERRNRIMRMSKADNDASIVQTLPADTASTLRGFTVEGDDLYWVDATTSTIYRLIGGAGTPAVYTTVRDGGVPDGSTIELAVTGDQVFWNDKPDARDDIVSCPRSVAACTPDMTLRRRVNQSIDYVMTIDTAAGRVFTGGIGVVDSVGAILSAPLDGGAFTRVVSAAPTNMAVDNTHVYFPAPDSVLGRAGNAVFRVDHDGNNLRTVAEQQDAIEQVAVDERAVYWCRRGSGGGLRKLAK